MLRVLHYQTLRLCDTKARLDAFLYLLGIRSPAGPSESVQRTGRQVQMYMRTRVYRNTRLQVFGYAGSWAKAAWNAGTLRQRQGFGSVFH